MNTIQKQLSDVRNQQAALAARERELTRTLALSLSPYSVGDRIIYNKHGERPYRVTGISQTYGDKTYTLAVRGMRADGSLGDVRHIHAFEAHRIRMASDEQEV